jgi:DNA mismatch endonuclease (patch repair protein)
MPQIDNGQLSIDNSDCCKIPKTNREFWVAKIRRNLERDVEVQHQLASMQIDPKALAVPIVAFAKRMVV